jgi:hypothetical protein
VVTFLRCDGTWAKLAITAVRYTNDTPAAEGLQEAQLPSGAAIERRSHRAAQPPNWWKSRVAVSPGIAFRCARVPASSGAALHHPILRPEAVGSFISPTEDLNEPQTKYGEFSRRAGDRLGGRPRMGVGALARQRDYPPLAAIRACSADERLGANSHRCVGCRSLDAMRIGRNANWTQCENESLVTSPRAARPERCFASP